MRSLLAASTFLRSGASPLLRPLSRPLPSRLNLSRFGPVRPVSAAAAAAADKSRGGGGSAMEAQPSYPGEIHVIVGPMFAGKTTALLRRVQVEAGTGRYSFFAVSSQMVGLLTG